MLTIRTRSAHRPARPARQGFRSRIAAATAAGVIAGSLAACSPVAAEADRDTKDHNFLRSAIVNSAEHQIYSAKGTASFESSDSKNSGTVEFVAVSDGERFEYDVTLKDAKFDGKDFTFEARLLTNAATDLSDVYFEVPKARELMTYVFDWSADLEDSSYMPTLEQLDPAITLLEKNWVSMMSGSDTIYSQSEQERMTQCRDELNSLYRDSERMGKAYDDLVAKKMIEVNASDTREIGGEQSQGFALRVADVSDHEFYKIMSGTSLDPVFDACYEEPVVYEDTATSQDDAPSSDGATDTATSDDEPSATVTYDEDARVVVYVGVDSGQLTGATFDDDSDSETMAVTVEFGRDKVKVKKPSPSISIDELFAAVSFEE
ncbi:hypothetical protein JT358_10180 [Micrococcales bacterium 31B]|nr:hypothetical protein [Micrococcales bacterium 31B]